MGYCFCRRKQAIEILVKVEREARCIMGDLNAEDSLAGNCGTLRDYKPSPREGWGERGVNGIPVFLHITALNVTLKDRNLFLSSEPVSHLWYFVSEV